MFITNISRNIVNVLNMIHFRESIITNDNVLHCCVIETVICIENVKYNKD